MQRTCGINSGCSFLVSRDGAKFGLISPIRDDRQQFGRQHRLSRIVVYSRARC